MLRSSETNQLISTVVSNIKTKIESNDLPDIDIVIDDKLIVSIYDSQAKMIAFAFANKFPIKISKFGKFVITKGRVDALANKKRLREEGLNDEEVRAALVKIARKKIHSSSIKQKAIIKPSKSNIRKIINNVSMFHGLYKT